MLTIESNVAALWNAIADDHTDQEPWRILSDAYADEGDEVAMQFCLWIAEKERYPQIKGLNGSNFYEWMKSLWDEHGYHYYARETVVPDFLCEFMLMNEFYNGSPTILRAYESLLEAWRLLTDDQRKECFAWQP